MKAKELEGRVALVTGASKGLGKAIALALADAGTKVVLVSRDETKLRETAKAVRELGAEVEILPADVSNEAQVIELAANVSNRFGKLHILVNNAGINLRKPVTEFTLEEWNRIQNTNVTSVFLMCRSFIPLMKGHGYGRLINVASMLGRVSLPGRTAYSASKAALVGFTKALALELAPDNITVNSLSPGPCATDINRVLLEDPKLTEFFLSRVPLGRWGRPEEIGALAAFLCSEAAGFITGSDIVIDGGWTAQ